MKIDSSSQNSNILPLICTIIALFIVTAFFLIHHHRTGRTRGHGDGDSDSLQTKSKTMNTSTDMSTRKDATTDQTKNTTASTTTTTSTYMSHSASSTSGTSSTGNGSNGSNGLKNVWDAPRNLTSREKKKHESNKKFSSSYYYAHNNPNSTGGYKDGLKMEDFTMNQPRLLSKTTSHASNIDDDNDDDDDDNRNAEKQKIIKEEKAQVGNEQSFSSTSASLSQSKISKPYRHITQYLWDDPGNDKGIATIRIDSLPDLRSSSSSSILSMKKEWKDVLPELESITADLVGEGLRVHVETTQCRYELKIPKLYGDAASVQTISKSKRLLIKITKKKQGILSKNSNNLNAWPQPGRKI